MLQTNYKFLQSILICCFVTRAVSFVSNKLIRKRHVYKRSRHLGAVEDSAFSILAGNIALCLSESDLKGKSGMDGTASGWTSWVDDASAFRLQKCMDALCLTSYEERLQEASIQNYQEEQVINTSSRIPTTKEGRIDDEDANDSNNVDWKKQRDDAKRYIQWIKSCPSPMIIELTTELREAVNATVGNEQFFQNIDSNRHDFLQRISCRIIALPSGISIGNLVSEPGSMVYGKLLYGGVTRCRMIGSASSSARRRAGTRTEIESNDSPSSGWLQYGGPERSYEAIDAGPCSLIEITILPKGLSAPLLVPKDEAVLSPFINKGNLVVISNLKWKTQDIFSMHQNVENAQISASKTSGKKQQKTKQLSQQNTMLSDLSGIEYIEGLRSTFKSSLGGLQPQINSVIRRVLDGRVISNADSTRRKEMETLRDLGLKPVRGLLLYGPPGCGKTALAREISNVLNAGSTQIVAAPELLDRWVGGSEKLVRELFENAEDELRSCNGDASKSSLHVVVIDEIDAVFRKRSGSTEASGDSSSGEVARASAVNQILSKMDGVQSLDNMLLIGMTNRRELLDDALLRPGRLEVQIEIPIPDKNARSEILQIHFEHLRERISISVYEAVYTHKQSNPNRIKTIDGGLRNNKILPWRKRQKGNNPKTVKIQDLSDDQWTGGFSGADIAGLVRCAGSHALARTRRMGEDISCLTITIQDVVQALEEIKK